jgi:hypothetical protein
MKLTPRQIEVLTEIFEGRKFDWRDMTPAQRRGRSRVIDNMRGWNVKRSILKSKSDEITAFGLRALEPHYADKERIAAAIAMREGLENEREKAEAEAKREREENMRRMAARRNEKLIKGYRGVLADFNVDVADKPDDFVLKLGNRIAEIEMSGG